jgi:hypothetical protein
MAPRHLLQQPFLLFRVVPLLKKVLDPFLPPVLLVLQFLLQP